MARIWLRKEFLGIFGRRRSGGHFPGEAIPDLRPDKLVALPSVPCQPLNRRHGDGSVNKGFLILCNQGSPELSGPNGVVLQSRE